MPTLEEELIARLERLGEELLAQKAPSAFVPFLFGCLLASTALLLLAGLAAAAWWSWQSSATKRSRLLAAVNLASGPSSRLRSVLGDVLPAWASQPDAARVEWMNTLTQQLWPHIEAAAGKVLLKDDLLEHLLNASTFWRPSILMGAHIGVQAVVLGQEPPRITGAKTFRRHETHVDEVLMEFSFAWASKMEVKLLVTLLGEQHGRDSLLRSMLSSATRVKVGVSNLVAKGTLRVALKPLLDELPVAGGVKVSLMGTPDFSYKVSTLGGNPYLLPGVEQLVASFIREHVLKTFTFPDGFSYDLVTGTVGQAFEKPEGLLEVTVVGATNVPRMDWYGKADPYCQLWLRDNRKLRTAVARRTLSPQWNEKFTFIVHSTRLQELTLCIFDSDRLSSDDLAGMATVPLRDLDLTPGVTRDLFVPLPKPRGKQRGAGGVAGGDAGGGSVEFSGQRERVVHVAGTAAPCRTDSEVPSVLGDSPFASARDPATSHQAPAVVAAAATPLVAAAAQQQQQQQQRQQADDDDIDSMVAPEDAAALRVAAEDQEAAEQEQAEHNAMERLASAPLQQAQQAQQAGPRGVLGQAPAAPAAPAGAGSAMPQVPLAAAPSVLAPAMSTMPSAIDHLMRLAASPLDALRSKRCTLHIKTSYMPLTKAEVEAMEREHSRKLHGRRPTSRSTTQQRSTRIHSLMNSGVLYVYLDHAHNLGGSTVKGFTRNFQARVRVGDIEKRTEHGQVPFRHRSNPVFDETLEVIVDGPTAQQRDLQVHIELWVTHMVRRPTFKGRVSLPLRDIIERGAPWRDTWPLEDAAQGTLTAELTWMGALQI